MRSEISVRLKKTLFFCIYLIILFFVFEAGFRVYLFSKKESAADLRDRYFDVLHDESVFTSHPYLPYVLRAGASKTINVKMLFAPEGIPIDYNINSLGFRGPEIDPVKSDNTYRIACLGGSTTFGAIMEKQCWVRRLEGLLREKYPQSKIEVINAGTDGYTTADSLVNFSLRVLPLKPDAIIIYHGMNDAFGAFADDFKPDYSHMRKDIPQEPLCIDYLPQIFEKSAIFDFVRFRLFRKVRENNLQVLAYKHYGELDTSSVLGYETFKRNITSIVKLAKSYDIDVILSNFNYCDETNVLGRKFQLLNENEIVKEIAADEKVIFVDNFNRVSKAKEAHVDTVHFSDMGHQQMAQSFFDAIVESQIIKKVTAVLIARR